MVAKKFYPEKAWCLPDKKNYWARAGLPSSPATIDPKLIIKANAIYLSALEHIQPVVYYLTVRTAQLPSEIIPATFGQVKSITVFVSTLGHKFDSQVNDLTRLGQTLEMFLLDAWGSESLEALNRRFDYHLREKHGAGTRRFSPGYGSVDIRMNSFIIKELLGIPEQEIQVLESGAMLPRKTTTCLIGWQHETE